MRSIWRRGNGFAPLFDELRLLRSRLGRPLLIGKGELVSVGVLGDPDDPALGQAPEQKLLGERLLDVLLDHPSEWASAEEAIVAFSGQPGASVVVELDRDIAVGKLLFEL